MVLVFNLGGGTCDASLISLDAGILEVHTYPALGLLSTLHQRIPGPELKRSHVTVWADRRDTAIHRRKAQLRPTTCLLPRHMPPCVPCAISAPQTLPRMPLTADMTDSCSGFVQVKATAGSTRLGGEAFDIRLTYLLAEEFQRQQLPMVRHASHRHKQLFSRDADQTASGH